ncbi:MAG TPA: hypothetical protein VFR62_14715 [Gemmatimonadales bacterium]|nr:hypothetical protein [Gemmatimonadales bacterium]
MAQPGECADRRPGLSQCVEYWPREGGGFTCKAVCYTPSTTKRDGGTDARTLSGQGADKGACKADLERQCKP